MKRIIMMLMSMMMLTLNNDDILSLTSMIANDYIR